MVNNSEGILLNQFSVTEKLAAAAAACVLAAGALLVSLSITIPPSYADFIVGNVT